VHMLQMISKVAGTDANVLITGENGTGKELVAREIHRKSQRHRELLVTVDMGAIPDTLFESELFGHKRGAYTDAKEDRIGKFQLAHLGSLFLDEIGNGRVEDHQGSEKSILVVDDFLGNPGEVHFLLPYAIFRIFGR